jgi:AraC family transcriptional regulator
MNPQADGSRYSSHAAPGMFGSTLAAHFHLKESEHLSTAWTADNIFAITRLRANTGIPDRTTPVPRESALHISVAVITVPLRAYQLWIDGKTIDVSYILCSGRASWTLSLIRSAG